MISRECDVCNVDVHRAPYAKHLRSKNHLESIKQKQMIIPEWLFKEPIEIIIKKIYNPKPFRQITRDNIKLDEKQLNKELAKKMISPYYFTDRALQVQYNITLESHHINHAKSILIVKPNSPESGAEIRYINKILKELSSIFA